MASIFNKIDCGEVGSERGREVERGIKRDRGRGERREEEEEEKEWERGRVEKE